MASNAQKLPAPRTIAPSREDVLSNLAFFFGDPVVPERLRDYSEHHAMWVAGFEPRELCDACRSLTLHAPCSQDLPLPRRGEDQTAATLPAQPALHASRPDPLCARLS